MAPAIAVTDSAVDAVTPTVSDRAAAVPARSRTDIGTPPNSVNIIHTHKNDETSVASSSAAAVAATHGNYNNTLMQETLIRLNNTAIELLDRHQQCRPCIDTLKDCLGLLQQKPQSLDSSVAAAACDRAQARLQQAGAAAAATDEPDSSSSSSSRIGGPENGDTETADPERASAPPTTNDLGVVVLPSQYNPEDAYHLLSTLRTSKVCLTLNSSDDPTLDLSWIRSILVYNYGIAHRCCAAATPAPASDTNGGDIRTTTAAAAAATHGKRIEIFCLQIFQYAETLLQAQPDSELPVDATTSMVGSDEVETAATRRNDNNENSQLLFRLVLTRNLMMLSCRLGLSLCEHYKETLDPIVADILGPLGVGGNADAAASTPVPGASAA